MAPAVVWHTNRGSSSSSSEEDDEDVVSDGSGSSTSGGMPLWEMASSEIESMRSRTNVVTAANGGSSTCHSAATRKAYYSFPPACSAMLQGIDGNHKCVDCGVFSPQWAAVRYGALLCLECAGHHRSLGVQVSRVRSVAMDEWSLEEILCMLEGGNDQLQGFFARHALSARSSSASFCGSNNNSSSDDDNDNSSNGTKDAAVVLKSRITEENVTRMRYKTKAARFYRQQMELHIQSILASGPYRGRDVSRRRGQQQHRQRPEQQHQQSSSSCRREYHHQATNASE